MTGSEEPPLPASAGGLIAYALARYADRFGFYALLALADFAVSAGALLLVPGSPGLVTGLQILSDAFIVGAVAIGVASHRDGVTAPARSIAASATARWGAVAIAGTIGYAVFFLTGGSAGFAPAGDRGEALLVAVTAPAAWLLLTAVFLGEPAAALSGDDVIAAGFTGVARAVAVSLRVRTLLRLALLAVLTVGPAFAEHVAMGALKARGVANPGLYGLGWDALISGPLAAIQTVFLLAFVRESAQPHRDG